MGEKIKMLDSKGQRQLKANLSNTSRAGIDNCEWTVKWKYCHGDGRTTPGNQNPNYIAYERTSEDVHRTRLVVREGNSFLFLTSNMNYISTEKGWGRMAPLMKNARVTLKEAVFWIGPCLSQEIPLSTQR
jgi:hypothetical protein